MSTMKEVCDQVGISYETLRFYCNEGLVPNVTRDKNNYRIFDERNIKWIKSLICLKKCGMSMNNMKRYMFLCLDGPESIFERQQMLELQKDMLAEKLDELHECIDYINEKQAYFNAVLAGEIKYSSNLIEVDD